MPAVWAGCRRARSGGFLRLGTYIRYIPHPVIVGFTNGIAILIFMRRVLDLQLSLLTEVATVFKLWVRDAMDRVAVRPAWGSHPRVAIYGLLEARMSRADLVICAGLTEGTWPAAPSPEPLLPPAVLRALGVPASRSRGRPARAHPAARDRARRRRCGRPC